MLWTGPPLNNATNHPIATTISPNLHLTPQAGPTHPYGPAMGTAEPVNANAVPEHLYLNNFSPDAMSLLFACFPYLSPDGHQASWSPGLRLSQKRGQFPD